MLRSKITYHCRLLTIMVVQNTTRLFTVASNRVLQLQWVRHLHHYISLSLVHTHTRVCMNISMHTHKHTHLSNPQTVTSRHFFNLQSASITFRDYSPAARRDVYNVLEIPCLYSVYRFKALHYTAVFTRALPSLGDHE